MRYTPAAPARTAAGAAHPGEVHPRSARSGTIRLPAVPSAAAATRHHVRQLLQAWRLAAVIDLAQLLASELVANAVTAAQTHQGGVFLNGPCRPALPIELVVRRTEISVIIEVGDPNPAPPVVRHADPLDEGGRGLQIIEILGTSWGYHAAERAGKVVWCEIALAGLTADLLALSTGPVRAGSRLPCNQD
jgi:hypothetical protein